MIESNSNIASMYASNIQSGVSSLEGVNPAKKDGVSQYDGNTAASHSIDNTVNYTHQVASKISEFMTLLHSVASEFETTDNCLSSSISSSSSTHFHANPSLFE